MGTDVAVIDRCADRTPAGTGDHGGRNDLGRRRAGQRWGDRKLKGNDPAIEAWKAGPDLPVPLNHAMAV
ncbi:hypothetical protein ACFVJ3_44665 [Rhodococcus sp. NPDC127593]|uniref:hypothetical protein n=1 Tax=Rhodococcus sp. NPDC127593 TaxID=3345404 RepID=UPI00363B7B31